MNSLNNFVQNQAKEDNNSIKNNLLYKSNSLSNNYLSNNTGFTPQNQPVNFNAVPSNFIKFKKFSN